MNTSERRIIVEVDASAFSRQTGDPVALGELLGSFNGRDVLSPCDGMVDDVFFHSSERALKIGVVVRRH